MEAPGPNTLLKNVSIDYEGKRYSCKIQVIKKYLVLSLDNPLKLEGYIHLSKIQNQIEAFTGSDINDIFEEINLLSDDRFTLKKVGEKYRLNIKLIIFRKEKDLMIELENKNINLEKDDLISHISELKEIIKKKDEKIKDLEDKLSKFITIEHSTPNETKENNLYNNFDIKLKDHPIHELNYHTGTVICLTLLKDGRMASGSSDNSIIIYNKNTYKPDLTIKEHSNYIFCLTQLSSGLLASCSGDNTIKLFNINGNNYNLVQTLSYHTGYVNKIIEIKNKQLISCSSDNSFIVYFKENDEYKVDYKISTNGDCSSVVQTKNNEICYSEATNSAICFFDILERKKIKTINNISKPNGWAEKVLMIKEDLLFIGGENKISLINVNQYNLIRVIDVQGSSWIYAICMLNDNRFLTGDDSKAIRQWKIEGDNLTLISKKENTHSNYILCLLNLGNGQIASGSGDNKIRIW